jgi:hypothetical protein
MEGTRESLLNQIIAWVTNKPGRRMKAIHTGSTAYPESAKRRWLIRSVQAFMRKSTLLEPFSAGGMTQI